MNTQKMLLSEDKVKEILEQHEELLACATSLCEDALQIEGKLRDRRVCDVQLVEDLNGVLVIECNLIWRGQVEDTRRYPAAWLWQTGWQDDLHINIEREKNEAKAAAEEEEKKRREEALKLLRSMAAKHGMVLQPKT